jgi:hypothetical protein
MNKKCLNILLSAVIISLPRSASLYLIILYITDVGICFSFYDYFLLVCHAGELGLVALWLLYVVLLNYYVRSGGGWWSSSVVGGGWRAEKQTHPAGPTDGRVRRT